MPSAGSCDDGSCNRGFHLSSSTSLKSLEEWGWLGLDLLLLEAVLPDGSIGGHAILAEVH
jgi:hypothetical protein